MRARRIAWLGIATPNHGEMTRFFQDVMGLEVAFDRETTTELSLTNGDRVQVFGPGHPYYGIFRQHARGPVVLTKAASQRRRE